MPVMPLMPGSADQIGSSMPGSMPTPPIGSDVGGYLGSMLGGDPSQSMGAFDPMSGAMRMFDELGQMITDLVRMFPGSEQPATEVMEALDRWRQQVLVNITPPPFAQPGAETMM